MTTLLREDQDDNVEQALAKQVPPGSVVITAEQLEQYQEFEKWVIYYFEEDGDPCRSAQRRFPKMLPWWKSQRDKIKQEKVERELKEKKEKLLSIFTGCTTDEERVAALVANQAKLSEALDDIYYEGPEEDDDEEDEEDED